MAVTFPGQGPQYPNMLRDALGAFPELGETLDAADRAYQARCGRALRPAFFTDSPAEYAQRDEDIHSAVFAVNVALFRLLQRYGLRPDALMGQSAGELAALVAAGTMSFEDGLAVVHERTASVLAIETDDPGKMIALACGAERALALARRDPRIPRARGGQRTRRLHPLGRRTGDPGARRARGPCRGRGDRARGSRTATTRSSSPRPGPATRSTSPASASGRPRSRWSRPSPGGNSTESAPNGLVAHLTSQFVEPVRLRPAVEELHARGIRLFVECGPKWPLTTFVGQILRGRPHVAIATIHPKVGEVEQLHRALACLFVHGAASLVPSEEAVTRIPPLPSEEAVTRIPPPAAIAVASAPVLSPPPMAGPELATLLRGIRNLIDGYLRTSAQPAQEPAAPVRPAHGSNGVTSKVNGWVVPPTRSRFRPRWQLRHRRLRRPPPPAPGASRRARPSRPSLRNPRVSSCAGRWWRSTFVGPGTPRTCSTPTWISRPSSALTRSSRSRCWRPFASASDSRPIPRFKLRDANTIAKAVAWLAARVAAPGEQAASAASGPPQVSTPEPRGATAGGATPVTEGTSLASVRERVRRMLLDEYVRRTGYPEDMLDPDLDLEAELGIDTVKQVAVLGAVRERLGLPPIPVQAPRREHHRQGVRGAGAPSRWAAAAAPGPGRRCAAAGRARARRARGARELRGVRRPRARSR